MITSMPRIAVAARDFEAMVASFRDGLGLPVVDLSARSGKSLGAKLAMCVPPGGSNIELMSPADAEAPLGQSLDRFLRRRGDGLFALMLEAPDPNAEAAVLAQRGLEVLPLMAGAAGRDVHPRSTHGVLIRVYPSGSFQAPSSDVQRNAGRALGLSGIARVILAVRDLKRARDVYGQSFGLATREPSADARRGVLAVRCSPPAGGAIELVEPSDSRRPFAAALEQQLRRTGEGMFALVLEAPDPESAAAILRARGLGARLFADLPGVVEIDPAHLHGARILIEAPSVSRDVGAR